MSRPAKSAAATPPIPVAQPALPKATRGTIRRVGNGYVVALDTNDAWADERETIHTTLDNALGAISRAMAPPPKLTKQRLGERHPTKPAAIAA